MVDNANNALHLQLKITVTYKNKQKTLSFMIYVNNLYNCPTMDNYGQLWTSMDNWVFNSLEKNSFNCLLVLIKYYNNNNNNNN